MKKVFKKGSPEVELFKEYYQYIQDYNVIESEDSEYWQNMVDKGIEIGDKYGKFAQKLIFAFLDQKKEECEAIKKMSIA